MLDPTRLAIWTTYQAAWSDISDAERRSLLARSVAQDCLYTDPQGELRGIDALVAKIVQSQAAKPGVSFRNDQLSSRGDEALSEWTMLGSDGAPRVRGASYARFGADGRLTHMSGFFARPDEGEAAVPTANARSWDVYQAAWARISDDQRRALVDASVAEEAVYSDPAGPRVGREALIAYVRAAQEKTPGVWFRQTLFLEHHQQAFSRWERLSADGAAPVVGSSYARFGPDGRLVQMAGFPGSQPHVGS